MSTQPLAFIAPSLDFMRDGLCAQTDPEAFHPEKGGSTREAKRVCVGCDVKAECLEYALGTGQRFGIWGGLSERERRLLLRAPAEAPAAQIVPYPVPPPPPPAPEPERSCHWFAVEDRTVILCDLTGVHGHNGDPPEPEPPAPSTWSLHDAGLMLVDGYRLAHIVKHTGYSARLIRRAARALTGNLARPRTTTPTRRTP